MQAQAPPIENGQPVPEYETLWSEIEQRLLAAWRWYTKVHDDRAGRAGV
jgi:hypothetical protein